LNLRPIVFLPGAWGNREDSVSFWAARLREGLSLRAQRSFIPITYEEGASSQKRVVRGLVESIRRRVGPHELRLGINVIAYSWGAYLTCMVGMLHPTMIRRAVFVSGMPHTGFRLRAVARFARAAPMCLLGALGGSFTLRSTDEVRRVFFPGTARNVEIEGEILARAHSERTRTMIELLPGPQQVKADPPLFPVLAIRGSPEDDLFSTGATYTGGPNVEEQVIAGFVHGSILTPAMAALTKSVIEPWLVRD